MYMVVSMTCSMAKDLGKSRGSSISEMKPKKATWATGDGSENRDRSPGGKTLRHTEGKDNVGHREEGVGEAGVGRDIHLDMIGGLHGNGHHGDDGGNSDTSAGCREISWPEIGGEAGFHGKLTNKGHDVHLAHRARKGADEADDQADDTEDDGAGTVAGDGVEQHGKGENVTGHQEDTEQQLAKEEDLASNAAKEEFTGIAHAVDLGVAELELADDIARIPGDTGQTQNEENGAEGRESVSRLADRHSDPIITYGTIPRVATAEGRDRIPREMFSAIITTTFALAGRPPRREGRGWKVLTNTAVPPFHNTVLDLTALLIAEGVVCRGRLIGGDLLLQRVVGNPGLVVNGEGLNIPGSGGHGDAEERANGSKGKGQGGEEKEEKGGGERKRDKQTQPASKQATRGLIRPDGRMAD